MSDKKKVIKIEGEAFEKLKSYMNGEFEKKMAELKELMKKEKEAQKAIRQEYWQQIFDACNTPEAERKESAFRFEPKYEDAGFYILEEIDCECGIDVAGLIKDIFEKKTGKEVAGVEVDIIKE